MILREDLERVAAAPRQVATYLIHRGWAPTMGNDEVTLWAHERGGELTQPRDGRATPSALRRIETLITALSAHERTDPRATARDIVFAESDAVRIRVYPDSPSGTVPLNRAEALVTSAKRLLVAAASTLEAPRPVLGPRKPEAAEDYGRRLLLGSEAGSFILTLYAPIAADDRTQRILRTLYPDTVGDDPIDTLFNEDAPFARRATQHLLKTMKKSTALANKVADDDEDITAFDALVPDGVSANLLEAAAELSDRAAESGVRRDSVDIEVRWAASRPAPSRKPKAVHLSPRAAEALAEAGKSLRARTPLPKVTLVGRVVGLQKADGDTSGRVTATTRLPGERGARRVHFDLPPHLYDIAVQAHRGEARVAITGDVIRMSRGTEIQKVTRFARETEDHLLASQGDPRRP